MPDHPLMQTALLVRLSQPLEDQLAVCNQRRKALRHFQLIRRQLAADPAATEHDLETLDCYTGGGARRSTPMKRIFTSSKIK